MVYDLNRHKLKIQSADHDLNSINSWAPNFVGFKIF